MMDCNEIIEIIDDGVVINRIVASPRFAEEHHPGMWRVYSAPQVEVVAPEEPTIEEIKASRIVEIKAEAGRRITALDWRLQRAQERELQGETGVETVADVLSWREQVRQASNAAEQALNGLNDIDDIVTFTW